jgi:hypothetical protein
MTADDRSLYLDAFSAAKKRVEREGRRICHVIWRGGHLEFTSAEPLAEVPGSPDEFSNIVHPDPQGFLL